ncbi:MAG: hypothetical protein NTW71_05550, partial [Deltaproteobacteria bacterium]|nr:hypothetical protein [Deltaproteobacteria bacterium]
SLVETALFLEMAAALLSSAGWKSGAPALSPADTGAEEPSVQFTLAPADISNFCGRRRENIVILKRRFDIKDIRIASDPALPRHTLVLATGKRRLQTDISGRIETFQLPDE